MPVASAQKAASGRPAEDAVRALETVTVTATKREETLENVPLTVAALSDDVLKANGVTDVEDLAQLIPSLNVTSASYGTDVYTIRGVGFYDTTLAAMPTVSVYVDEVSLPYSAMTGIASLDPERVEVLMGPQGTLFGQNSTGGAINYISAKPTDRFEAGFTGTLSEYDTVNVEGYLSGPLSESVRARLAVRSLNTGEGWQKSVSRPGDDLGVVDRQEARLLVDWDATDRLFFRLSLNGFTDTSDTQAPQYLGYVLNIPSLAFTVPDFTGSVSTARNTESADWDGDAKVAKDNSFFQASLRWEHELSDTLRLVSITSYTEYEHDQFQDVDGLPLTNINFQVFGKIEDFSQELRLSGELGERGDFLIGANYQSGSISQNEDGFVDSYTTAYAPIVLAGLPQFTFFRNLSDQDVESQAVFVSGDYDLTDQVTVHAGARYTRTTSDYAGCTIGDLSLTAIAGSTNPPGECVTFLPSGVSDEYADSLEEDNVSWRVSLDYNPVASTLLYATVSQGYKAGSFPVIAASTAQQLLPVTQEEVLAYELGFKSTLLDNTMRASGAVFYYDYSDKQIRGRLDVPIFGLLETLLNVPESQITGAELNLEWTPVRGLLLNGGVSYIESEIQNYSNYAVTGEIVDLDSASFPNAPDLQFSLAATYDWAVSSGIDAYVGANYNYASETRGTLGFTPELDIDSYGLLDLRAGIAAADDQWDLSVWVRNLTDEYYVTGANRGGEALLQYAGRPQTFGVTFTRNFR